MVRLSKTKAFRCQKILNYLITYDHSAGHSNRYTVMVLNADDPVVIGRELDLKYIRTLIADYEEEAKKLECYMGDKGEIYICMANVIAKHLAIAKGIKL